MPPEIYQWIDLFWIPVACLACRKGHRLMGAAFTGICAFSLRMQVELMDTTGHPYGWFGAIPFDAYQRGLFIYGCVIALFLALAHYAPGTLQSVFLAAMLSVYLLAFAASMIVMLV
jgi:hypothetical protein